MSTIKLCSATTLLGFLFRDKHQNLKRLRLHITFVKMAVKISRGLLAVGMCRGSLLIYLQKENREQRTQVNIRTNLHQVLGSMDEQVAET